MAPGSSLKDGQHPSRATSLFGAPGQGSRRFALQKHHTALLLISAALLVLGQSAIWGGHRDEVSSQDSDANAALVAALRREVVELQEELRAVHRDGRRLRAEAPRRLAEHGHEAEHSHESAHEAEESSAEAVLEEPSGHETAEAGEESSSEPHEPAAHEAGEESSSEPHEPAAHEALAHGGGGHGAGEHGGSEHEGGEHEGGEHEGGGHGHGGHGGHHGHHIDNVTLTIAWLLFGFLATNMGLLYLVNYNDENIRVASNQMISTTMSIFNAVLLNQAIFGIWFEQIIPAPFPRGLGLGHPTYMMKLMVGELQFCFWWVLLNVSIYIKRQDRIMTYGFKNIVGHLTAFAAIQTCGNFQQVEWVKENIWLTLGIAVVATPCFVAMTMVSSSCRKRCCMPRSNNAAYGQLVNTDFSSSEQAKALASDTAVLDEKEGPEDWVEQVVDGEDEAAALCTSFLIMQVIVQHVVGEILPLEGDGSVHPWKHVRGLSYWCLLLFGLVILSSAMRAKGVLVNCFVDPSDTEDETKIVRRLISLFHMNINLSFCWCMWRISSWCCKLAFGNASVAKVATAYLMTAVCVLTLILLDCFADRLNKEVEQEKGHGMSGIFCCSPPQKPKEPEGDKFNAAEHLQVLLSGGDAAMLFTDKSHNIKTIRALMASLGFLVGIVWEKAIDACDETIVEGTEYSEEHPVLAKICLSVLISTVVLPGWGWYIVPKALMTEKDHLTIMMAASTVKKNMREAMPRTERNRRASLNQQNTGGNMNALIRPQ